MQMTHQPMIMKFFSSNQNVKLMQKILLVAIGTILLTISAKVQIPFYPVNTTMQTFAVIMIGFLYGKNLGALTIGAYLLEGALGLPVFTSTPERGIGLAYMAGPTAGYLLGFVFAAYLSGWLAEKGWGKTILSSLGVFILGAWAINVPGLLWLNSLFGFETTLGIFLSYQLAFALKTGLGTLALPMLSKKITQ